MANIKRLEELAQHLETGVLGHGVFNFGTVNNIEKPKCGTAGCAMGECPILWRKDWKWDDGGFPILSKDSTRETTKDVMIWFDIEKQAAYHLFHPYSQKTEYFGGANLSNSATRQDVAANIRAFIKIKQNRIGTTRGC